MSHPSASPGRRRLQRAVALYVAGIEHLAVAIMAALVVVAILQVFFRYVLNDSLSWSEELMRYLMIWEAYLVAGVAYSRGEMLGMRFVVDACPPPVRRALEMIGRVLIAVFLIFTAWYGTRFVLLTSGDEAIGLSISLGWVHASVPVGAALLTFHVLFAGLFAPQAAPQPVDTHGLRLSGQTSQGVPS